MGRSVFVLTYKHEACGHTWNEFSLYGFEVTPPSGFSRCPNCTPKWLARGARTSPPDGSLVDIRYEGPSIFGIGGKFG